MTLRDMFTGNIPLGFNADPQYNKFTFNVNGMPIDPSMMGMMGMPTGSPTNLTATQNMGKAQPAGQPSTSAALGYSSPFPTSNNGLNLGYGSFLGNSGVNSQGFLTNAPAGGGFSNEMRGWLGNSPSMGFGGFGGGGLRQQMVRWA